MSGMVRLGKEAGLDRSRREVDTPLDLLLGVRLSDDGVADCGFGRGLWA